MSRFPADERPSGASTAFVLYVEGPRDRDILRTWAQRVSPPLGRALVEGAVILGGRQPERALAHFRNVRAADASARGLCVLDRDANGEAAQLPRAEPGFEFFVWRRRHIESYLLVPDAIRRSLRISASEGRVTRALRRWLPAEGDESAYRDLDAKRLLAGEGELARAVGRSLQPSRIARAMRQDDLHRDVLTLFERARAALTVR